MTLEVEETMALNVERSNSTNHNLLLGLDGEASLGNTQITYKLYDENGNLLNECGELEAAAYRYFVEE